MRQIKVGQTYRHFKGNNYVVLDIVKDSDDKKDIVVYEALYGEHQKWTRPLKEFMSRVDKKKYPEVSQKYRFEEINLNINGVGEKEKSMLAPAEIAKSAVQIGEGKGKLKAIKMLLLGMFAGAFIALAGVGSTFGNVYVGKLAGACIFPAGLLMVVVAGSELFTGNNLMVQALFSRRIGLKQLLKNWGLVFLGNFIGAMLVALAVVFSGALEPVADVVVNTAMNKVNLGFGEALLRGILCNFLVCIAVWMSFGANSLGGKAVAVFFPVMLFVLCGFEHSVANMYYIPAGLFESAKHGVTIEGLNFGTMLLNNLLPVTLGNIIGGAGLVGAGYYFVYLREKKAKVAVEVSAKLTVKTGKKANKTAVKTATKPAKKVATKSVVKNTTVKAKKPAKKPAKKVVAKKPAAKKATTKKMI